MRVMRWLLIVAITLQGLAPALVQAREADAPASPIAVQDEPAVTYAPADLPAGAPVTIQVEPAEVAAGGTVTVSGQGAAGSTQVRLAVVNEGKTLGIQDVALNEAGQYAADIPVSDTYPPGPVQLCALAVGLENAEVACAVLLITPPANGSVSGVLPLDGVSAAGADALDAEFRLMNAAGATLYSNPLKADGTFKLDDVAPGAYLYSVAGRVPKVSDAGSLVVRPVKDSFLELNARVTCTIAAIKKPTTALQVNPSRAEFIYESRGGGLFREFAAERRPFGLYVTGVQNNVTFTASPQATGAVDKVVFEFFGVNGKVIERLEDASAPYSVVFNVGRLPASRGDTHPFVAVTPVVGGEDQCASFYDIEVMGNPMSSPYLQPIRSRTTWEAGSRTYQFEGVIPYVEDLLPASYSLGSVPFLGEVKNEFNTGVYVRGYFDLEGQARIYLTEVFADAVLLSLPILAPGDLRENVTPPGLAQVRFDIGNPAHMAIPYGPLELYQRDIISIPFPKILIFTYFGIFNAYVSGGLIFGVGLYLEGVVRPLAPAVDSTLTGTGRFGAELGLSADILLGIVEGGGGLGGEVCVGLPLRVVVSDAPDVYFDDPVVGGRLYLVAWASALWGLVKTKTTSTITDFGRGCPAASAAADADPPAPDIFPSPAVVASSDGRVLAAYVENTAPPGGTPQVQIVARFQDANTGEWSEPQAISDPAHSSQSPTVAFVGPNHIPLVAWAENTLTAEEAAALGDEDPAAHMRRLEIFYALWNDGWGAPIRLTDDDLPDGLPEAAGSDHGAVLAWTTDRDGDAATRGDQRIAVSTFDLAGPLFGPPTLLEYPDPDHAVLNNDVTVVMADDTSAYVAWVYDLDADLTTGDDRRLAVVHGGGADWVFLDTSSLPARVDSPAITRTPEGVRLAFLVREPTPDGEVGVLGTNGVLWTARQEGGAWTAFPIQDAAGNAVYAEQPKLDYAQEEELLVFRRFDEQSERGALGQISLSRIYGSEPSSPPLNLTDAGAQQWLPAVAISPFDGRAVVLHSALPAGTGASAAVMPEAPASPQVMPAAQSGVLQGDAAPVLFLTLGTEADPALDPLQASVRAPAPGSTVVVTATVRNVGRGDAFDVTASLYQGTPGSGVLVGAQPVPDPLAFNAAAPLAFAITVPAPMEPGGQVQYYVALTTTGENAATGNDVATITLGGLSAPGLVSFAGENPDFEGALDLTWSGNAGEYVTGYRILRADTAATADAAASAEAKAVAGPWALAGESAVPAFTDTAVTPGQTYCYAVQAYNAQGAFSPRGPVACGLFTVPSDGYELFVPVIRR